MIAELPEISLFKSARELAAWAGVTPCHFKACSFHARDERESLQSTP